MYVFFLPYHLQKRKKLQFPRFAETVEKKLTKTKACLKVRLRKSWTVFHAFSKLERKTQI